MINPIDLSKAPTLLIVEVDNQRIDRIAEYREYAEKIRRSYGLDEIGCLSFDPGHPLWDRVKHLDSGYGSVTLRPYPDKATGVWRIETSAYEKYVNESEIYALFEMP